MITILGAGVAGASLARALTARGRRDVAVFDPDGQNHGSSARATGGFRTQFSSRLNIDLSLASRPFFASHASEIGFRSNGYVYVASGRDAINQIRAWRKLQSGAGLPVDEVDPAVMFPGLMFDQDARGNFCALDGVYDPRSLLAFYRDDAAAGGARFYFGCQAGPSDLEGDAVVIACGVWSGPVARALGVSLSVVPEERHVWTMAGCAVSPAMPLGIDMASGWVFRERDGDLLVVSPGGLERADPALRAWLSLHLPAGASPEITRHWTGFYENSFDHHPLVGQTAMPGIWASCGFSGHGIMHSPALADCLAAMIVGDSPPLDITALSPLRSTPLTDPTQM